MYSQYQPQICTQYQPQIQPQIPQYQRQIQPQIQTQYQQIQSQIPPQHQPQIPQYQPQISQYQPQIPQYQPQILQYQPQIQPQYQQATINQQSTITPPATTQPIITNVSAPQPVTDYLVFEKPVNAPAMQATEYPPTQVASNATVPLAKQENQRLIQNVGVAPSSKFVCYLIPFPSLIVQVAPGKFLPSFVVYTQPAPPMRPLAPGEKESRLNKAKRKWEKSLGDAKTKGGIKGKAILALDSSMAATKNSRVEFLSRCPKEIKEFELNYPPTLDPNHIQQTFMQMLEITRKGAQRDVKISTALLPVTFIADLFFIFWPLPGPFFPVDAVWAFANYQALTNSNSIIKSTENGQVTITYNANPGLRDVERALEHKCLERDPKGQIFQPALVDATPVASALQLAQAVGYGKTENTAVLDPATGMMMPAPQWPPEEIAVDLDKQLKKSAREYYRFVKKNRVKAGTCAMPDVNHLACGNSGLSARPNINLKKQFGRKKRNGLP